MIQASNDKLEAFSILNPSWNNYRFLFRSYPTDANIQAARRYIAWWLDEHEMSQKREKHKKIAGQAMFEVIVWLN